MQSEHQQDQTSQPLGARLRKRVGFDPDRALDRGGLNDYLASIGYRIPFENLRLTETDPPPLTETALAQKIITAGEGGLCYEINPLLAAALQSEGIDARTVRATIIDQETGTWFALSRTHVTTLVRLEDGWYVADAGFGVKQPLGLVPLGNEAGVDTPAGRYRVVAGKVAGFETEWVLQYREARSSEHWTSAYGFEHNDEVVTSDVLEEIREQIAWSPSSVFNRGTLVAQLTPTGKRVLSAKSLTETRDGLKSTLPLAPDEVALIARVMTRQFTATGAEL